MGSFRYIFTGFADRKPKQLTARERDVALLAAASLPDKTIAMKLCIHQSTVGTHLRRVFSKQNIRSRSDLIVAALGHLPATESQWARAGEKESFILDFRERSESYVRTLVVELAIALEEPDLGRLFHGLEEPLVLVDLQFDGCRFILNGIPESIEDCLTCREQEITGLIACGVPNKSIADVLAISALTVGTHVQRILSKCHVGSRADLPAMLMAQHGRRHDESAIVIDPAGFGQGPVDI